jgi:hypothetical protein
LLPELMDKGEGEEKAQTNEHKIEPFQLLIK